MQRRTRAEFVRSTSVTIVVAARISSITGARSAARAYADTSKCLPMPRSASGSIAQRKLPRVLAKRLRLPRQRGSGVRAPFRRCRGEKGAEGVFHFGCGIFATISSFFAQAALRDGFSSPCRAGTACRGPHEHLDIDFDLLLTFGAACALDRFARAHLSRRRTLDHSGSPFCQSGPTSRAGSCAIRS